MLWLLLLGIVLWAITRFYLRGEDLTAYDNVKMSAINAGESPSEGHRGVVASMGEMTSIGSGGGRAQRLRSMRQYLDDMGKDVAFAGEIIPVETAAIRGEWLVPAGADTRCRLLYIHGGAWIMGSPLSHRAITSHYATMLGVPVFSLDYRLMPEHSRQDGIDDCRIAYRWLLANGPAGEAPAREIIVSGDSAGGNLTLSLLAWIRDVGAQAPVCAVAFSPATDGTFSAPSMQSNVETDYMLGPQFGKLNRIPSWVLLWFSWWNNRTCPSDPSVSPIYGSLGGLPPLLVQASSAEMLHDDAVRYVNKARASGSPVQLQTWEHMVHVWQIFLTDLPEARAAFAEIEAFIQSCRAQEQTEAAA